MGAMIEPPLGVPDMPSLLEALDGLDRDISGIIEHDLYPCAPDVPAADRQAHPDLPELLRWGEHRPGRPFMTSKTSDLRIAVLGVGLMGAFHVDALSNRVRGARVTVVSDFFADKAAEVAERVGARVETDPIAAINADDVDAVLIASPGTAHEEQVNACLDRGIPVLCEKPLTTDIDSAHAHRAEGARAGPAADPGRASCGATTPSTWRSRS